MNIDALKRWFQEQQRDLPWRKNPSPYSVWVSEIMLQQTRVSVVEPYFLAWMREFPTIEALAYAPLEKVLKQWEGLGYYSRARNLHAGAKYVLEVHGGVLPSEVAELKKIKGIGDYTVGAIRAFAFKLKAAAIDGNVLRVIARHDCIEDGIDKLNTQKEIRKKVEGLLPENEPWLLTEGLIELGATLCKKQNPHCVSCPIKSSCESFKKRAQDEYPKKKERKKGVKLHRLVCVARKENLIALRKGNKGKVMQDLYEFPYFELEGSQLDLEEATSIACTHGLMGSSAWLEDERHSFTRYDVFLKVIEIYVENTLACYEWVSLEKARKTLAFSAGHRRILAKLK